MSITNPAALLGCAEARNTMTPQESITVVRNYYQAYQAEHAPERTKALLMVLGAAFALESPLVEAQSDGPVSGETALRAAEAAASLLKNADIESLYATLDGTGVVALIRFPSPVGVIVQSEHFDIDPDTGLITRLRSYYDPRKLLKDARAEHE